MSDEMYTQRWLQIDGVRIPVIIDDSIPYDKNGDAGVDLDPGQFASDIYLLPFYGSGWASSAVHGILRLQFREWTDAGCSRCRMTEATDRWRSFYLDESPHRLVCAAEGEDHAASAVADSASGGAH